MVCEVWLKGLNNNNSSPRNQSKKVRETKLLLYCLWDCALLYSAFHSKLEWILFLRHVFDFSREFSSIYRSVLSGHEDILRFCWRMCYWVLSYPSLTWTTWLVMPVLSFFELNNTVHSICNVSHVMSGGKGNKHKTQWKWMEFFIGLPFLFSVVYMALVNDILPQKEKRNTEEKA